MTDKEPLPVAGYTPQSDDKIALVNEFKQDEERLLRKLDKLRHPSPWMMNGRWWTDAEATGTAADPRWLAIAQTHFQEGWMALERAVLQPARIRLPEDDT